MVALAVLVDLDDQPLAERVDHADTDTVQTTGDLVAVAAELAAGVQHGEHDLGCVLALVRTRGVRIDRNAAPVVVDADAAIGQQRDGDARAEARHRLVDSVVDDLPNQVVEARQTGGSDVHSWPFSDRVETLQNLDVFCPVVGRWLVGVERHAHLNLSAGKARLTCGYVGDQTGWLPALQLLSRSFSILSEGCDTKAAIRPRIGTRSKDWHADSVAESRHVRAQKRRDSRLDRLDRRRPRRRANAASTSLPGTCSCVAHAGSSTSTTSLVPSSLIGLT